MKSSKHASPKLWLVLVVFLVSMGTGSGDLSARKEVQVYQKQSPSKTGIVQENKQEQQYQQVPDLTGMSLNQAQELLSRTGLNPGKICNIPGRGRPGTIVRQDPRPKMKITRGEAVDLWVCGEGRFSKNQAPVKSPGRNEQRNIQYARVPELIGLDEGEARKELTKAGLRPGRVFVSIGKGEPNTVLKQSPRAGSRTVRGANVDLWVQRELKSPRHDPPGPKESQVRPEIVRQGGKIYLQFPETVRDITISDARGKRLQQFPEGKRFDISSSVIQTKAGKIKVSFTAAPDKLFSPNIQQVLTYDLDRILSGDALGAMLRAMADEQCIESGEPGNNQISGAVAVNTGSYAGTIDPDDVDYLEITAPPGGFGSVFSLKAIGDEVQLDLYGPQESYLTGGTEQVWIALKPNTSAYVSVIPTGFETTQYCVSVYSKRIPDASETNDSISQAKSLSQQPFFLCNVLDSTGNSVGVKDWYYLNLQQPCLLQIDVSIIGFDGDVTIYVYEPSAGPNSHYQYMEQGDSSGATLVQDLTEDYDPDLGQEYIFPPGNWKILVTSFAENGYPLPYGTGAYPVNYIRGYNLQVTQN